MCVETLGFEVPYAYGETNSGDSSSKCLLFIDVQFIDGLFKHDAKQPPKDNLQSIEHSLFSASFLCLFLHSPLNSGF